MSGVEVGLELRSSGVWAGGEGQHRDSRPCGWVIPAPAGGPRLLLLQCWGPRKSGPVPCLCPAAGVSPGVLFLPLALGARYQIEALCRWQHLLSHSSDGGRLREGRVVPQTWSSSSFFTPNAGTDGSDAPPSQQLSGMPVLGPPDLSTQEARLTRH